MTEDYLPKVVTPLELAMFLHRAYEEAAEKNDWETQDGTSVEFEELPEENQQTMIDVASAVLQEYEVDRSD